MSLYIANGKIVDPSSGIEGIGSILIEDGIITAVEFGEGVPPEGCTVIDASGKMVTPGLIDLHVHFREPGQTYKEDVETGGLAAAAGGFTSVCMMPNTKPVIDTAERAGELAESVEKRCCIRALTVGAITEGQLGKTLSDMEGMQKNGIIAVSEDGRSVADASMMLAALREAKRLSLPVLSHTEDDTLRGEPIGEELIAARDILLAAECKTPVHLCHISTARSVDIIRTAKAKGIPVTAETAPHYISLDKSMINGDGNRRMNPPLRQREDVEALIEGLRDGTIDAIATDHAPHASQEKDFGYDSALNGVIGLETAFPVCYTELVRKNRLGLSDLVSKLTAEPAKIIGIPTGIEKGKRADIAVFDVENEYVIDCSTFKSRSRNTPFHGMRVFGRPVLTVCGGRVVYNDMTK